MGNKPRAPLVLSGARAPRGGEARAISVLKPPPLTLSRHRAVCARTPRGRGRSPLFQSHTPPPPSPSFSNPTPPTLASPAVCRVDHAEGGVSPRARGGRGVSLSLSVSLLSAHRGGRARTLPPDMTPQSHSGGGTRRGERGGSASGSPQSLVPSRRHRGRGPGRCAPWGGVGRCTLCGAVWGGAGWPISPHSVTLRALRAPSARSAGRGGG